MNLIKSSASDVLDAISKVSPMALAKSTMPILSNVLISKAGNTLKFICTDTDVQSECTASLGGDEGRASTTVAVSRLLPLLKSLAPDQVVTLSMDSGKVTLKAGRSKFTLQTLPVEGFPLFREDTTSLGQFTVSEKTLAALIDQTHYAMADNPTQPHYNGLFIELVGNNLSAVASDGKRLAVSREKMGGSFENQSAILPRKSVLELRKLLGTSDEPVTIKLSLNQARFDFGNVMFLTRLVSGKYVQYERALPKALPHAVTLNRRLLLDTLRRSAVIIDEKFKGVRFKFTTGLLTIVSTAVHEEGTQELECDYTGDPVSIGLPVAQVVDGLANFGHDLVNLSFDTERFFHMAYSEVPDYQYIVGLMRI